MRKSLLVGFLAALVVCAIVAGAQLFNKVKATTSINSSIITSDTTWTKANSPYSLTGPVKVNNGVTLTIAAGATVNLNGYYIRVEGTLVARGTSSDKIYINGGDDISSETGIHFWSACTSWNEQTGLGCIIENANFNSCPVSVYNIVKITNTDGG